MDQWLLETADGAGRLYVCEVGSSGPTVIGLHGGPGAEHGDLLSPVSMQSDRHRFVLYDQRGCLRSPMPVVDETTVSFEKQLEDLESLRIELGERRIGLLGHSAGAALAMSYLTRHPRRVDRLVLVGAPKPPTSATEQTVAERLPERRRALLERPEVQAELAKHGLDGDAPNARQRTVIGRIRFAGASLYDVSRWSTPSWPGNLHYRPRIGELVSRNTPDGADHLAALAAHERPVHVIVGDHDFVDPGGELWQRQAERTPGLHVHVLPNAGHFPWIDQPAGFADVLRSALA